MNKIKLRRRIIRSLTKQGFRFHDGQLLPPKRLNKRRLRRLHVPAVQHQIDRVEPSRARKEDHLLERIARGSEVVPEHLRPRLIRVLPDSEDELLFRYARLHWSIPVSAGYGRRLRFLVIDEHNAKLIGILGLADPVFGLGARDEWIGWNSEQRCQRLVHVMDTFVLGTVPPYSSLLCGKLVAMLAASNEVRRAFGYKYRSDDSLIGGRAFDGRLAMITTTSALG